MHSAPIYREMYVRPPKELREDGRELWKLLNLPYAVVEAARQWKKVSDDWLTGKLEWTWYKDAVNYLSSVKKTERSSCSWLK